MTVFEAILLGVVQGITEFFPISSSGHLILIPELFGWQAHALDFDVALHVATLCSILWILREDIARILKGVFSKNAEKEGVLGWKIVVATLPVVFAGLFIAGDLIESVRSVEVVAYMLIVWGVVLWMADCYSTHRKKSIKKVENAKWTQAIAIGVIQIFALIPGSSRSGVTMSGGLFAGFDRKTAARFSFLLAVPAIAGAGVLSAIDAMQNGFETPIALMTVGFIAAFFSGALAIKFLLSFLQKWNFKWFAGYRIILGLILLALFVV